MQRRCGREQEQGGFLLVTLLQSVLCVMMISGAFVISSVMGLTDVKAALASLVTEETEAVAVFAPKINQEAKRIGEIFELILQMVFEREKEGQGGSLPIEGNKTPDNVSLFPPVISSRMRPPLEGEITSGFGYRLHPISQKPDWHMGVDISAALGSRIAAAWPGTVEKVASDEIYGNYIIMHHGNFKTRYCHCLEIVAKEGQHLRAGETVALVGSTGISTGPHLHFELITKNGVADPLAESAVWRAV
ncbi:MAG: M23 family metallopeptidase [Oscillospiraceae bacterium]|nr:M23 family metallopeptidase [Oscillospiraceae bacterium]